MHLLYAYIWAFCDAIHVGGFKTLNAFELYRVFITTNPYYVWLTILFFMNVGVLTATCTLWCGVMLNQTRMPLLLVWATNNDLMLTTQPGGSNRLITTSLISSVSVNHQPLINSFSVNFSHRPLYVHFRHNVPTIPISSMLR